MRKLCMWWRTRQAPKYATAANQWAYDQGYAQGHSDGSATVARCRSHTHIPSSEAPFATFCTGCAKATGHSYVPQHERF